MVGPPLTRDGPAIARFRFFFGFDSTTTKAPGAKSESESTTMGAGIEADSPTFDDIGKWQRIRDTTNVSHTLKPSLELVVAFGLEFAECFKAFSTLGW